MFPCLDQWMTYIFLFLDPKNPRVEILRLGGHIVQIGERGVGKLALGGQGVDDLCCHALRDGGAIYSCSLTSKTPG